MNKNQTPRKWSRYTLPGIYPGNGNDRIDTEIGYCRI